MHHTKRFALRKNTLIFLSGLLKNLKGPGSNCISLERVTDREILKPSRLTCSAGPAKPGALNLVRQAPSSAARHAQRTPALAARYHNTGTTE